MYGRKGKLNIVIFMDIHTFNTQFMVSYSQAGGFKEMLYHRKSHMYGRKGNFKVVILWTFTHLKHNLWFSRHTCNYWFYTHSLVVSKRCYITEEDHTCMEEKESETL